MGLDSVVSIAIDMVVIAIVASLGLLAIRLISRRITRLAQSKIGMPESRRRQLQTLVQVIRWIVIGAVPQKRCSNTVASILPDSTMMQMPGCARWWSAIRSTKHRLHLWSISR